MATSPYHPDPYRGWSNLNPASNVTAYEILNDTSGQWQLRWSIGFIRSYEHR